jgi:hypothetical protein
MPFWPLRRKETLNERLMREAGLEAGSVDDPAFAEPDPEQLEESWFGDRSLPLFERLSGEVTAARPRRWDAVVSAEATVVAGHEVEFVALPDGSLIVEREEGEGDLTPLADAVETQLARPYRAQGRRRGGDVWAVAARKIQVASFDADGDEIELVVRNGERTLSVDGDRSFGSIPELEKLGQGDFVVRALRLEGSLWELRVDPL